MSSIVISGDTSGAVTIEAPAIAGTPTLTLPTTSGTLVVTGGAQTVQFAAGSAAAPSITFTGDTNTGIFSPAADSIAFTEGGVESMRIDASGNVGIGTSSPSSYIFKNLVVATSGASTGISIVTSTTGEGTLAFGDGTAGTDSYRGYIQYKHLTDSMVFGVAGTVTAVNINSNGNIALLNGNTAANGVGITFPATQSASTDANCLDDYEEGSWTPTIAGTSTAGTASYVGRVGTYTKIGNVVTCIIHINWNSGTGVGSLVISGLPFTSANDGNFSSATLYYDGVAFTSGWVPVNYLAFNSATINLLQTNGGVSANIPYDAAGVIVGTLVYRSS